MSGASKIGLEKRDGYDVGRDPREMSQDELRQMGHKPMSALKALRLKCLDCCTFSANEVRLCVAVDCPSWPFRLTGASATSTITIPDRAIVLAVSTRTVTAITGATSYDCGIAGTTNKFGGSLGIAAGSTNVGVIGPQAFYAATPIILTANGGNFTGGAVRVAIQYLLPSAPTA